MSEVSSEALRTIYEQSCQAHNAIADFRAKLLALLPIASGAGIFLLLGEKITDEVKPHFVVIGAFGALVTIGLFLYELRNIHRCNALIDCGELLEKELAKEKFKGAFLSPRKSVLQGFVSLTWASLMIYPAVIGAWSYVICMGIAKFAPGGKGALLISGATVVFFMLSGYVVDILQNETSESTKVQESMKTTIFRRLTRALQRTPA